MHWCMAIEAMVRVFAKHSIHMQISLIQVHMHSIRYKYSAVCLMIRLLCKQSVSIKTMN